MLIRYNGEEFVSRYEEKSTKTGNEEDYDRLRRISTGHAKLWEFGLDTIFF